jgi:hypothetical protein
MRNKYPGLCYWCKKHCEVGDGHFERYNGRWLVIHDKCVFLQRRWKSYQKYKEQVEKQRLACLPKNQAKESVLCEK